MSFEREQIIRLVHNNNINYLFIVFLRFCFEQKMSKDIRSFFPIISKKVINKAAESAAPSSSHSKSTKRSRSSCGGTSSSDDIIPGTPKKQKTGKTAVHAVNENKEKSKRKRIVETVSSDSEPELNPKKVTTTVVSKNKKNVAVSSNEKKFISPLDAFGDTVVKQDKTRDEDFQKTPKPSDDGSVSTNLQKQIQIDKKKENVTPSSKIQKIAIEDSESLPLVTDEKNGSFATPQKKKEKKTPRKNQTESEDSTSSVDQDQDRYEKKRYSAMLYQKFLNRSGPIHPGSKWIPKGKPDCLKNLCFIITGILDSLEREEAQTLVKDHGGRCTQSVSGKVNFMVLGEDAGPAKIEKARKLGTKMITEDELIDLICVKSGIQNQNKKDDTTKIDENVENIENKLKDNNETVVRKEKNKVNIKKEIEKEKNVKKEIEKRKDIKMEIEKGKDIKMEIEKEKNIKMEIGKGKDIKNEIEKGKNIKMEIEKEKQLKNDNVNLALVDKYKPKSINEIIGQQGEKSNVKKLVHWLENWYKNQNGKTKLNRPSPWSKSDDGSFFKAALLSGPPGVGKTTSATLVAKHLGFDTVEFNASDTRNKKMIHQEISQMLKSTSLAGFLQNGCAPTKKHVLIMDEVDGMSGNEDRGGMQELIGLIKQSKVPIICMCNDRQHPKIRTLANYCFDLRFEKPRMQQIRGAMLSICFKENIKIGANSLAQVIQGTDSDVRQTLNQLSILSLGGGPITDDIAEKGAKQSQKDIKLGPWAVIRKVFSEDCQKTMSIMDKTKLFFYDYSIGPLFVQENYLKVIPHCEKKEQLQRFADAANSISLGDLIDARIRSTQNWSLLEMQAMYASVLPGHYLSGHFGGQIDFPGWLGKNSKANKFQRMSTEIYTHTRTSTSGNKDALTLDYLNHLRDAIVKPLARQGMSGIPAAIKVMSEYRLLRDDLTNMIELSHWPKSKDLFNSVDSKVKAAFTRAYNKECTLLPYSNQGPMKKKTNLLDSEENIYQDYDDDDNNDDDNKDVEDIGNDVMIKAKKQKTTKTEVKASASKRKVTKKKK